ncbi:hypothetical protein [Colwellia psychrerythraea]|uniref:Uncharacterized protein n=1 Tax=Colwellia psychrerythraea (strain 34H / ATCC BAA-681) TaxID=167879 RepID=Q485M9_COLP3|nr:hypothetical protein [Colwellia psychrerythraea]AAZ24718.1 hypothetical protein CPS_1494 [Colwellia psychrerythraea 34H]
MPDPKFIFVTTHINITAFDHTLLITLLLITSLLNALVCTVKKNTSILNFVPIVLVINYLAATLDFMMSIANPLSARSDIPRNFGSRIEVNGKEKILKPDLGGIFK